ncbi:hypothetical protein [Shewanella sp. MM_2022_3]|uniref:hypothetical protein n=1 Tax=Shewanella sp. MM_2022_3 TaxID=2923280 RepID=UPI001F4C20A5|nr:hypothetical protein [Shewanella sp. MM_2022_3]MCH7421463.1 hypothetical protein [Shewanella sp. MM_2022_3]
MIDIALKSELETLLNVQVYFMEAPESAIDNFVVLTPLVNQFNAHMDAVYSVNYQVSVFNKSALNGRELQGVIFDKFYGYSGDINSAKDSYRVLNVNITEQQPIFESDTKLYQFITDINLAMDTR